MQLHKYLIHYMDEGTASPEPRIDGKVGCLIIYVGPGTYVV